MELAVIVRQVSLVTLVSLILAALSLLSANDDQDAAPSQKQLDHFEKKIRPLLIEHCLDCHSGSDPSGKLALDSQAGWKRGGERGPAIVPGNPNASLLFQAVTSDDPDVRMPPEGETPMSPAKIRELEKWIRAGAADPRDGKVVRAVEREAQKHWAFQPLRKSLDSKWISKETSKKNPIDWFIDQTLVEAELKPTPQADQRTLVRRAVYDLHGLPPSPEHFQAAAKSWDHFLDELLKSPRYGERWGRHWLDVARYSDAKDGVLMYGDARIRPFAYTYRDYVIRAFNQDKPFDQFIREQIAADQLELPSNSPDLAAMGFLTLGRMFDRNPHDVIDDQIDVVTRGFLGLTVSCARCHDHKFDPVPTADYYSLYGVFASSREPLDRPRIESPTSEGAAFEREISAKLNEINSVRERHYEETLQKARERTADYLVAVATTEPDFAETAIFFLSLTPDQLRPQITHRWRELIARRAHPNDPVFAPWYDLLKQPGEFPVDRWKRVGVDPRIIKGLVQIRPETPEQVARAYGEIIHSIWAKKTRLQKELRQTEAAIAAVEANSISLADVVAGGSGMGNGKRGNGIHPVNGKVTTGSAGFINTSTPDQLIAVEHSPLVDGVFVPKSDSLVATSTGIRIEGLRPSSGQTWDYFKSDVSNGSTHNSIDGVDYSQPPNSVLAIHANKGITFDLAAIRERWDFRQSEFRAVLGHSGATGESLLDFHVFLDGKKVFHQPDFPAQSEGKAIQIRLAPASRFLTLVSTEGRMGISHDQAILGNPRIVMEGKDLSTKREKRLQTLTAKKTKLTEQIENINTPTNDPLLQLLVGKKSPTWFPIDRVHHYLSRQKTDAFRGLINQVDAIAVRHRNAAARAMIMVDQEEPVKPVIFQRGDPGQSGNPVPRRFLKVLSPVEREPFANGSGRLELANAIADPENPLTARVWVNRIWMHHFGKSLAGDPSNFGLQSVEPVQLKLLDFLAASLIENGWKSKPIHKMIMKSKAYRRSSLFGESDRESVWHSQMERDPDNQYLWCGNRRRLDLEQMRDSVLKASGKLDYQMFGRPRLITDPDNFRRTVYAFVERQNLPNIVQTFDFANADTSTGRRPQTTVPQQALFALNSTFMIRHSEFLADSLQNLESSTAQTRAAYQRILQRDPSDAELSVATKFLQESSLSELAQVLMMSNEFMFID